MGRHFKNNVVVYTLDDFVRSALLEDYGPRSKKAVKALSEKFTPQPLRIEFKKTGVSNPERVKLPRKKAHHLDMHGQAKACANALLRTTPYKITKNVRHTVTDVVEQALNPFCFYFPDLPHYRDRFVLAVGRDLSKIVSPDSGIDVVAGTNIALPFDRERHMFYLPYDYENQHRSVLGFPSWKLVSTLNEPKIVPRLLPEQLPVRQVAQTAEEALDLRIDPRLAAWYLGQQLSGGHRYITFRPWAREEEKFVRREHLKTYDDFRRTAVEACIKKWGRVIPAWKIENYFAYDNGLDRLETKTFSCTNVHHRQPISFGGDNTLRTLIDTDFHNYIHHDFDHTQSAVCKVLHTFKPKFEKARLPTEARVRKFLIKTPEAIDELNRIPHVKASTDGTLSLAILWPQEIFCIPALLQFEYQNGGIYGPKDRGYIKPNPRTLSPEPMYARADAG